MVEETPPQPDRDASQLGRRAASNTAFLLVATLGSRLVGLLAVGYIARNFDVEGLGGYNLTLALIGVFGLLADFGISIHLGREVAADPSTARHLVRRAAAGSVVSGIAAFALCNLVAAVAGYDRELREWILIASTGTLLAPAIVPIALVQARLQGGRVASVLLANQLVSAVVTVFVVVTEQDIRTYIALQAVAYAAHAAMVLIVSRGWRHLRGRFDRDELRGGLRLLVRAAPYGSLALFALVLVRLDTFILSVVSGERAVGFYSSAWKLSEMLHFVPVAVGASVAPIVASQLVQRPDLVARGLQRAFRYLALSGIPVGIGGVLLAEPLIVLIYGPAFEAAAAPYRILIVTEVFYWFAFVAASALVGMRALRPLITVQLLTVPANALVCLALLPRYGYTGAAWITLATELVEMAYMTAVVARTLGVERALIPVDPMLRSLVACVPMVGAVLLVGDRGGAGVLLQVLVGAAIYGVALVAVRGVGSQELQVLRGLTKKSSA